MNIYTYINVHAHVDAQELHRKRLLHCITQPPACSSSHPRMWCQQQERVQMFPPPHHYFQLQEDRSLIHIDKLCHPEFPRLWSSIETTEGISSCTGGTCCLWGMCPPWSMPALSFVELQQELFFYLQHFVSRAWGLLTHLPLIAGLLTPGATPFLKKVVRVFRD